ncbi:MAG: hypothetical protein M3539_18480 [Acidobacteriota bacterium]|nr:hypothetical protein [Acidobacteriota bacterium]
MSLAFKWLLTQNRFYLNPDCEQSPQVLNEDVQARWKELKDRRLSGLAKSKKRKTAGAHRTKAPPPEEARIPETLKKYISAIDLADMRKRPRLLSLLFCDFHNLTVDGKANVIGIFDRIYVRPDAPRTPRFVLYGRTAETFNDILWIRVFDPDNKPVAEIRFDAPSKFQFPEGRDTELPKQAQFMLPIGLAVTKPGVFWFDIAYGNISIGGAGLVIKYVEEGKQIGTDTYI